MRRQTAIVLAVVGVGVLVLIAGVAYFVWNDFQDREAKAALVERERLREQLQTRVHALHGDGVEPGDLVRRVMADKEAEQLDKKIEAINNRWGRRWDRLGLKWRAPGRE